MSCCFSYQKLNNTEIFALLLITSTRIKFTLINLYCEYKCVLII